MKILFIHQNFPGQFKFLAPALVEAGHVVRTLTMRDTAKKSWLGVTIDRYTLNKFSTKGIHPWVSDFESKAIRAEACFRAALELRKQGYEPDLIIAHHGWGESLFLKDVWPKARLGIYCEFFYKSHGLDVGFDPEFPEVDEGYACKLGLKNVNNLLHMQIADAGISPTNWQASTFPEPFRSKITIAHDGIDTDAMVPNPEVSLTLGNGQVKLTRQDEIITFVNRNLEPYRGYHIFMRALPEILKRRPNARILIVGGDGREGPSYGPTPGGGDSWKEIFKSEISSVIAEEDWARVHYSSNLPYQYFTKLLQLSTVHVYLTYPFILSWSLLEAMSVGCSIVASATPPVLEVIRDNETGRVFDFFDAHGLADQVCELLEDEAKRSVLGKEARKFARSTYDLRAICLPEQISWVEDIA